MTNLRNALEIAFQGAIYLNYIDSSLYRAKILTKSTHHRIKTCFESVKVSTLNVILDRFVRFFGEIAKISSGEKFDYIRNLVGNICFARADSDFRYL